MSDVSSSPVTSGSESWLSRVRSAQERHTTPEQRARVVARNEAMRRRIDAQKKATRTLTSQQLSAAAWRSASHNVTRSETLPATTPPPASIAARATSTMMNLSRNFITPQQQQGVTEAADEDALSHELALTTDELVRTGEIAPVYRNLLRDEISTEAGLATAQAAADSELQQVLKQLEREPPNDEARAAKFELYEGFATTVSTARGATLALWDEVRPEFDEAPAARAEIERQIQSIDAERNLGVPEHARHWFVHGMVAAAARNAQMIERVLAGTRTKLELLTAQSECPVCFEPFERPGSTAGAAAGSTEGANASGTGARAGCTPTTLGCAHQVCTECWGQWRAMAGPRAFCPLCRHEDFLSRVLGASPTAANAQRPLPRFDVMDAN